MRKSMRFWLQQRAKSSMAVQQSAIRKGGTAGDDASLTPKEMHDEKVLSEKAAREKRRQEMKKVKYRAALFGFVAYSLFVTRPTHSGFVRFLADRRVVDETLEGEFPTTDEVFELVGAAQKDAQYFTMIATSQSDGMTEHGDKTKDASNDGHVVTHNETKYSRELGFVFTSSSPIYSSLEEQKKEAGKKAQKKAIASSLSANPSAAGGDGGGGGGPLRNVLNAARSPHVVLRENRALETIETLRAQVVKHCLSVEEQQMRQEQNGEAKSGEYASPVALRAAETRATPASFELLDCYLFGIGTVKFHEKAEDSGPNHLPQWATAFSADKLKAKRVYFGIIGNYWKEIGFMGQMEGKKGPQLGHCRRRV